MSVEYWCSDNDIKETYDLWGGDGLSQLPCDRLGIEPEPQQWQNMDMPGRLLLKCDGTRAKTRFRLSAKRTSPFKSAGASVQTTGSRGVCISGSNAGYTKFRGSVKSTGHPLHSPISLSLPLPCVTVCHHISSGLYIEWVKPCNRNSHSIIIVQAKVKTVTSVKQVSLRALFVLSCEEQFESDRGIEFIKWDYKAYGEWCWQRQTGFLSHSRCYSVHHKSHMNWFGI
jgi:hypothetical protein